MPNHKPLSYKSQTQLLHGQAAPAGFVSCSPATMRASTTVFPNLAAMRAADWRNDDEWSYGLKSTPTSWALAQRIAALEGGQHTLLLPSGLGAISLILFALLQAGDDILIPDNVYSPTREHADWLARDYHITVQTYHPMIGADIAKLIRPNTKLIWLESPGSVTMEVPDIAAIARVAKAHGIATALDNTWSAGVYLRAFELGVDIAMQALTKYQSGGAMCLWGLLPP